MEKDLAYYRQQLAAVRTPPSGPHSIDDLRAMRQEALLFLIAELLLEILVET